MQPIRLTLSLPLLLAGLLAWGQAPPEPSTPPKPAWDAALATIEPGSLKAHVSFLASDALEGRDTPSRGLDIAAEYIAAQFRAAGLEPAGDDGYFQTARWTIIEADPASYAASIAIGNRTLPLAIDQVSLLGASGPLNLDAIPLVRLTDASPAALEALTEDAIAGKAIILDLPPGQGGEPRARVAAFNRLRTLGAAVLVTLAPDSPTGTGLPKGRLINPERRPLFPPPQRPTSGPVRITLHGPAVAEALRGDDALPSARLTLRLGPPVERPVTLRNVAGILRGSDPELRETCVIVSAHYDHIGVGFNPFAANPSGTNPTSDPIYNGANDDASGTALVVELARALGRLDQPPRRSLLFLTFFGEEKGLLGSRFYGDHPLVPLEKTVAMINLEHVGRTDDTEGPQLARASLTGFDFSDVGPRLQRAAAAVGVEIFKHPRNSDAFFGRSDNQALADRGIPAHTLCVAYLFPDYHAPGDHWDKLDYDNMALIGRAVGLGLLHLADDPHPPAWNADNPKAAKYRQAAETRRPAN
ncbi:MAG: peptidase M28 [Isosphaeraceae bacterium]|nr:MAG: peptidase M28 [Isosphaeraceae bacterium]